MSKPSLFCVDRLLTVKVLLRAQWESIIESIDLALLRDCFKLSEMEVGGRKHLGKIK
jgi:hypothetical protein